MSFTKSLVDYVEAETSLVTDTDLFVGVEVVDAPAKCVVITETAGSNDSWSGLQIRTVQIVGKDLSYIGAETLIESVYDLFAHKPGFPSGGLDEDIFYCDVISRPALIGRDERRSYIFTANLLFKKS